MAENESDDAWSILYPESLDISSFCAHTVKQYPRTDDDLDTICASYQPEEHVKLCKNIWTVQGRNDLPYPLSYCIDFCAFIYGDVWSDVWSVLCKLECDVPLMKSVYLNRTKALTDWVKRRGPRWREDWRLFIDLSNLVGFNLVKVPDKEKDVILHEWCSGVILRASLTECDVIGSILKTMRAGSSRRKALTLREFVATPDLWVTKGSGKGVKVALTDTTTGNIVESTSNKSAVALSMSVDQIYERLTTGKSEVFTMSDKVEVAGKGRIIISPGWELNLLMAYVMYYFEPALASIRKESPLWLNTQEVDRMWLNIRREIGLSRWMYPQDASKFDQTLATDEFDALIAGVFAWIKRQGNTKLRVALMAAWRLVQKRWKSARVRLATKGTIRWEHGMPSGIRLTAIGDTIVSVSRAFAVLDKLKSETKMLLGMGDDLLLSGMSHYFVLDMFNQTNAMGVTVNAAKNFASRVHAEFLRVAVDNNAICGYPARHVVKHLYNEPGAARMNLYKLDDMRAFATSCNIFIARQCSKERVLQHLYENVTYHYTHEAIDWVHTPSCVGGLGWQPWSNVWIKLKQDIDSSRYMVNSLGTFETMFNNTIKLGVDVDTTRSQLASRVVRGLPGAEVASRVSIVQLQICPPDLGVKNKVDAAVSLPTVSGTRVPGYTVDISKTGQIMSDAVIDHWVQEGDWDSLLVNASSRCSWFAKRCFKTWERKAFIMYVKGKLPSPLPRVAGWSDQAMSALATRVVGIAHRELMSQHRVSTLSLLSKLIAVELSMIDFCLMCKNKMAY